MNAMRHYLKLFVLTAAGVAAASCGDVARTGRAPVFLVIDSITGNAGGTTGTGTSVLSSDVQRMVTSPDPCTTSSPCPTVFSDSGTASFHLTLKDSTSPGVAPSANNQVTLSRYHVSYRRADGRNAAGVDVPYAFDGALTITIPATGSASSGFELVRIAAKQESPLVQLINNPTFITTIADVTFYGQDLVGNEIQATGSIQVDFGNFGDR